MSKEIKLGDKVKDTITGFKGIAVARTIWINGCDRIVIQPEGLNKEGATFDVQTFDEPQVEIITSAKPRKKTKTGGPPLPRAVTARKDKF